MELYEYANIASGILSGVTASLFGVQIYVYKLRVNLATWFMIFFLDFIGLSLTIFSGNSEPYLQFGWACASVIICIAAWVRRGVWSWGRVETWATLIALMSVIWWIFAFFTEHDPAWSLMGYIGAMVISVVPQAVEYWKRPREARKSAWLWIVSSIATILAICGAKETTIEYLLVPTSFLILNLSISWLTLRTFSE